MERLGERFATSLSQSRTFKSELNATEAFLLPSCSKVGYLLARDLGLRLINSLDSKLNELMSSANKWMYSSNRVSSGVTKLKSTSNLLRTESMSPNGPPPKFAPLDDVLNRAVVKLSNRSVIGLLPLRP